MFVCLLTGVSHECVMLSLCVDGLLLFIQVSVVNTVDTGHEDMIVSLSVCVSLYIFVSLFVCLYLLQAHDDLLYIDCVMFSDVRIVFFHFESNS